MIQENELLTLCIGLGALTFLLVNYRSLARIPHRGLFLAAFVAGLAGWIFTVAEGFFAPDLLNLLEHVAYTLSSALVAGWVWISLRDGARQR
jgi:hypothetical protein